MRKEILLLAAFLVLASVVQAKYSQTLTASDLLRIAHEEKEDVWFIKFYGQNCGFCKSMADEWERFAKMVHDEDLDLKVGEIDVHDPAIQQGGNDIRQLLPGPLPGLHLFPVGDKKFYEFPNPRIYADADGYLNFALFDYEKATASFRKAEYMYEEATEITNIDGATFYEDILESQKPVYLMIYGPKCGWCKTFMPTWEEFAKQAKEKNAPYVVGRMDGFTNLQLVDSVVARPWPSIIYYQPDGKYYRIDTDLVRENMNAQFYFDWIDEKTYLEADDEHSGQDSGIERFTKLRKAKEESKKRKQQKAAEKKDL